MRNQKNRSQMGEYRLQQLQQVGVKTQNNSAQDQQRYFNGLIVMKQSIQDRYDNYNRLANQILEGQKKQLCNQSTLQQIHEFEYQKLERRQNFFNDKESVRTITRSASQDGLSHEHLPKISMYEGQNQINIGNNMNQRRELRSRHIRYSSLDQNDVEIRVKQQLQQQTPKIKYITPINTFTKPQLDLSQGYEVPRSLNKTELGHYKEIKLFSDQQSWSDIKPVNQNIKSVYKMKNRNISLDKSVLGRKKLQSIQRQSLEQGIQINDM
ncbi:UNKNOWN [Stylonychia lemnae]|uniref:Uncharacterized protein n=1 Tax=Stylonychia lemnae TaxID=5949 RepID=A0A078AR93_STYLE|nr:UNKNOWN [Stylonychia lemnae]|eukprot:CDW84491.1 UNKNOWN [Stylonychia lemnae]